MSVIRNWQFLLQLATILGPGRRPTLLSTVGDRAFHLAGSRRRHGAHVTLVSTFAVFRKSLKLRPTFSDGLARTTTTLSSTMYDVMWLVYGHHV